MAEYLVYVSSFRDAGAIFYIIAAALLYAVAKNIAQNNLLRAYVWLIPLTGVSSSILSFLIIGSEYQVAKINTSYVISFIMGLTFYIVLYSKERNFIDLSQVSEKGALTIILVTGALYAMDYWHASDQWEWKCNSRCKFARAIWGDGQSIALLNNLSLLLFSFSSLFLIKVVHNEILYWTRK